MERMFVVLLRTPAPDDAIVVGSGVLPTAVYTEVQTPASSAADAVHRVLSAYPEIRAYDVDSVTEKVKLP